MKLSAYLRASGLTITAFAQQAGLSEAAISRYLSGKRTPRADAIRRIVRASRGRVQPEDLLPVLAMPDTATPEDQTARGRHPPGPQDPALDSVDLVLPDLMAIPRGQRIPARDLPQVRAQGVRWPEAIFLPDAVGCRVSGTGLAMETGSRDRPVMPVDGQVIAAPWTGGRRGLMLMTMRQDDGTPHLADPRNALARVLDGLAADGFGASIAVDLEFYLLAPERDAAGRPHPAGLPPGIVGDEAGSTRIQAAALHRLDAVDPVLTAIARGCDAMDMMVEALAAGQAPGQFKVSLRQVTDPLRAADEVLLARHLVRETARRHGLQASFMSKPFTAWPGSGLHVHAVLVDGQGRNIFARGDAAANRPLAQALAGAMATMAESMAIFAATANAYRRFGSGVPAPASVLRISGGPARARRIEHRIAGAEANPYLVMAAILAGMRHGIAGRLSPPGDSAAAGGPPLPQDWPTALLAHDRASVLPGCLGGDFWRLYGEVRRAEMRRAQAMVPDTDYQLYLDGC